MGRRIRPTEGASPQQALAAYAQLFKERPQIDHHIGAQVVSAMARVYYESLRDAKPALEMCDWGLQKHQATRPSGLPAQRR